MFHNDGFRSNGKLIAKESLLVNKNDSQPKFPVYIMLEKQYLEKDKRKYFLKSGQTINTNLLVKNKPLINIITTLFGNSLDSIKNLKTEN